jgi:hypothetical protein
MGILSMLVKLGIDSTQFEMGIKRAQGLGERFGTTFKGAVASKLGAALSVAAIAAFTKNVIESADKIQDLSEQLNLTTDQIQRLQILAGETGVTFDKFGSVLAKFEQIRLKATSGDQDALRTLQSLGFTTEQLYDIQLTTIDGAVKAAEAHKNSGKSAETTAAMIEIYGLKLKTAASALADYNTTSQRTLISSSDIDVLAKANTLLDEQLRIVKTLAAPVIASGITATAAALKRVNEGLTKPAENYIQRWERANKAAKAIYERKMSDEALSRIVQQRIEADRQTAFGGPVNPPPIGTPQFERVKGDKFSLGGSQDPLARIGGFSGFQGAQDTAIRQAIEQTLQLKMIVKNTDKTSRNTED